jgi:molybdenum cofactor cytidylyltransferase
MKLYEAFGIARGDVVALIGAGGKTSTMVALGYELAEMGWRVIATTTTRISDDQLSLFPHAIMLDAGSDAISAALSKDHFVFLYDAIRDSKVHGPKPGWIPRLMDAVDSDVILVEADGARGLPLKAPYDHEPVIPPETSLVIPVASLSAVGQPLDEKHVYNVEAVVNRYGFTVGNRIKPPWIAQVVRDDELGLRGVPENIRTIAFLNQASHKGFGRARARLVARLALRHSRLQGVAMGSIRAADPVFEVQRPMGVIILAAGMSTRMGQPKVLLPWEDNQTILEHIVEQFIKCRLDHITVVTGHMAKQTKEVVAPLGAKVVYNRSYKTGEMLSSLKAGLRSLPDTVSAALIALGDQPRIQPRVINQVMLAYAEGKGDIVAPSYEMQRGHPILIDRRYWNDILNLPRGGAPRDVINAHSDRIHYVNVDTDSVLHDVDTPQDYADERWRAGLKP